MRLAWTTVALVALIAVSVAGCGSGESDRSQTTEAQGAAGAPGAAGSQTGEGPSGAAPAGATARGCKSGVARVGSLRVTGTGCATGRAVAATWSADARCASPAAASRFACSVRGYRCLGAATERGLAVSCARPGRSIAFVARRG